MKKKKLPKSIVTYSLEHISKEIFSKYSRLITELMEQSSGIYALYDETDLYYVGKASELRRRVKQHLKDRHDASWTHFSLFLVKNSSHINDIESLAIRIANPKGNKAKPRGGDSNKLKKQLIYLIKQKQREEIDTLFSRKTKISKDKRGLKRELKGLVDKRTPIYRTYKGKEYKAILTPAGTIVYKNKKYQTPTPSAQQIVKGRVNGWYFWYIKNKNNEWVKLKDYYAF